MRGQEHRNMHGSRLGRGLVGAAAVAALAACDPAQDQPTYDLKVMLTSHDAGTLEETRLHKGTSALRDFGCELSIRLGQCKDGTPIQIMLRGGRAGRDGGFCPLGTLAAILEGRLGTDIPIAPGDGGLESILVFQGDDNDGNGLIDPGEQRARAIMTSGTLRLERLDSAQLVGLVDVQDADQRSHLIGRLTAVDNSDGVGTAVGPRCTWELGRQDN